MPLSSVEIPTSVAASTPREPAEADEGLAMLGAAPSGAVLPTPLRSPWAWHVALGLSLFVHAALLVAAVIHFSAPATGGGGHRLEGIEVTTLSAAAFDSYVRARAMDGGQAAPAAPAVGADPAAAPPPANSASPPAGSASPPLPVLATPEADQSLAVTGDPPAAIPVAPAMAPLAPQPPQETPADPTPPTVARPAADAGGAEAQASITSVAPPAVAAAAPGDIARYAGEVRKALSRSRPRQRWPAGKLLVAFTVAPNGSVFDAELMQSSGNSRLDKLTLGWITTTQLPAPPDYFAPAERRYSIPLTFR